MTDTMTFKPDLNNEHEKDAYIHEKATSPGGASHVGHHYIQAYNQDKWGFYLRYIRGLKPKKTKPALIFGRIIHDSKEAFYRSNGDVDFTLRAFLEIMRAHKDDYEDREKYATDLEDGHTMLRAWTEDIGTRDFEEYDIIEIEGSHEFTLPNNMTMSVRWDALFRDKKNN